VNGLGYERVEVRLGSWRLDGEEGRMLIAGAPLGRLGVPGDIAPAVAFPASVEAAWIAGETLRVGGGVR
jgi:3-oxoacyl-[acyl-carrier protein] reductase